jgi:hypothetical protein
MTHLDAAAPPFLRRDSDLRLIVSPVINADGTTSKGAGEGSHGNREHDVEGQGHAYGQELEYPQFFKVDHL